MRQQNLLTRNPSKAFLKLKKDFYHLLSEFLRLPPSILMKMLSFSKLDNCYLYWETFTMCIG